MLLLSTNQPVQTFCNILILTHFLFISHSEGRHLADVRTQLQQTSDMQHYMQQEAEHLQLSIRNDEINERVDQANAKWRKQLDSFQQHVKDRNKQEFHSWSNRALGLENEAKKREHEDRLKTLSVS